MKTKITFYSVLMAVLICLGYTEKLSAQSFEKGTTVINAGFGFGSTISYYSGIRRSPLFTASGEYGIAKVGPGTIGAGLALGYQTASYKVDYGSYYYKDRWTTTLIGLRGTYHPDFLNSDKYDVYGVIQLSFDVNGYSFSSNDPYYNHAYYGSRGVDSYVRAYLLVGGRYYFTPGFGVFAEIGYDVTFLKFGASFKF